MFTTFSLKNNYELEEKEEKYLRKMLTQYSLTKEGLWLQALPYTKYKFKWCSSMTAENGICGCFSVLFPKTIFLQDYSGKEDGIVVRSIIEERVDWIEYIFRTAIHELRHAYQFKRSKIAYVICCLPILRQFTLEIDAKKAEKDCVPFEERWIAKYDDMQAQKLGLGEKIFPD